MPIISCPLQQEQTLRALLHFMPHRRETQNQLRDSRAEALAATAEALVIAEVPWNFSLARVSSCRAITEVPREVRCCRIPKR